MVELEQNKRYVVTKAGDDGTFELGDHIHIDGLVLISREARGWIAGEDIATSLAGVEVSIDTEYYEAQKDILRNEIREIEKMMPGGCGSGSYSEKQESQIRIAQVKGIIIRALMEQRPSDLTAIELAIAFQEEAVWAATEHWRTGIDS